MIFNMYFHSMPMSAKPVSLNGNVLDYIICCPGIEIPCRGELLEEKDGKIYVSSDASPEDTEKQVTGEGFPYNEGEYFITDYVLDAETFTLLSLDETLVAPDGSTRPYVTATIEYDVERPELAQTMYEHSTAIENLRQVTLTTDPDTENEETFSVQVPKGDGVVIYLPEGYDGIFTDRACTKEEESPIDRNADATLYMAKGK